MGVGHGCICVCGLRLVDEKCGRGYWRLPTLFSFFARLGFVEIIMSFCALSLTLFPNLCAPSRCSRKKVASADSARLISSPFDGNVFLPSLTLPKVQEQEEGLVIIRS